MSTHKTIRAFVQAGGLGPIPPTIAEVADELGLSNSTARAWMEDAVKAGLLEKEQGKARGFKLSLAGQRIASSL